MIFFLMRLFDLSTTGPGRYNNESPSGSLALSSSRARQKRHSYLRAGCSFVLQIRIQKWIQSLPRVLSGHRANPRARRQPRLCLFPRDMSQRDNGSFPFLGDVGETTAVNGNPFGDVNAKFSIQPQPRALIIKSCSYCNYSYRRATSKCVCLYARRHRSFFFFPNLFKALSHRILLFHCRENQFPGT